MKGTGPRILLVEDDEQLGQQLVETLDKEGYETTWLRDGDQAMTRALTGFRLVVLDLMLPGASGFEVLRRLRRESDVPVLILSARMESADKVRSLALGADDYLSKPFWPEELIARVRARLRRPLLEREGTIVAGGLRLEPAARKAFVREVPIDLTRVEFDVLASLIRRRGEAVSRRWLVENVLDPDREGNERTLDVHVSRLRRKLGAMGPAVATVWGIGYRFEGSDR